MKDISHIKKLIHELNGQFSVAQFAEEELVSTYDSDDISNPTTYEIETSGSTFNIDFDDVIDKSEFGFFEDGKQRTIQIAYLSIPVENEIRIVPVHYYAVGVVILKRINKKLSIWGKPLIETGIVIHKNAIIEKDKIKQIEGLGLNILDTSSYEDKEETISDYYQLKRWALEIVKKRRIDKEQDLIDQWIKQEGNTKFLTIDGSLINLRGEDNLKQCIAVSRGSRINIDKYDKIMRLKEFERSWTFTFHSGGSQSNLGVRNRISWFLRLRDNANNNPEFGLIRLELHPSHRKNAASLANSFSKSLIIERLPTSYPENNWDKTLYPIAVCSKYLSAIMPSIRTIKSSMKL